MYWPAVLCREPVPIRDIIQNDHKNRVKKDGGEYRGGRDAERTQLPRYFYSRTVWDEGQKICGAFQFIILGIDKFIAADYYMDIIIIMI